jgi:hypothetical protein
VEQAHEQSTDGGSGIRRRRVVLRAGVDESQLALASQPEVAAGRREQTSAPGADEPGGDRVQQERERGT